AINVHGIPRPGVLRVGGKRMSTRRLPVETLGTALAVAIPRQALMVFVLSEPGSRPSRSPLGALIEKSVLPRRPRLPLRRQAPLPCARDLAACGQRLSAATAFGEL